MTRAVLETLRVMASIQSRFGPDACRRYIVSFTRSARDVAAVYELARQTAKPPALDVIPLFETLDDLARSVEVMEQVIALPPVRDRLAANGRELEVIVGYSDSAKEAGPLSATLALNNAQSPLSAWAARRKVKLTLFHGRGGALGRGGGPAHPARLARAPGSVDGRFKGSEHVEGSFAPHGNQ